MDLGGEQKAQKNFVKRENARFDLFFSDVKSGRLRKGDKREHLVARYGAPVLTFDHTDLYRRPADFFASPKVYLDFDENDRLANIRIEEADGKQHQ